MASQLVQAIRNALPEMKSMLNQVPDVGHFETRELEILGHPGKIVCRIGSFESEGQATVVPEYRGRRFVEIRVFTLSGESNSRAWVFTGPSREILEKISQPEAILKIVDYVRKMKDGLEQGDYK